MGTYWDAIQAENAPPGTGRYAKAVGLPPVKGTSADDDYASAKADAQKSIAQNKPDDKSIMGKVLSWTAGAEKPILPQTVGAIAALKNMIGGSPQDTGAVYRGYRDAERGLLADSSQANPVSSLTGETMGLMAGGEGLGALGAAAKATDAGQAVVKAVQASKLAKAAAPIAAATTLRVNPAVLDKAVSVGKAALAGGATGGLLSGLEGGSPADVATGAGYGAVGGAGVEGILAPAAKALVGEAGNVGNWLKGLIANPDLAPKISQEEITAAQQAAAALAARKGVTSANVLSKAAPYTDPIAGQMLGTEGQNLTAALARRGGATGDAMQSLALTRKAARPDEIKQAMADNLGVSPDEASGNIDAIVKAGQASVKPGYQAIADDPTGVTSPPLERLLATPQGQKLQKFIQQRAALEGKPSEGLTWAPTEVPEPGVGVNPVDAPIEGRKLLTGAEPPPDLGPAPQVKVPRGQAEPPGQGYSLTQWMARQGGAVDTGGALGALDLGNIGARSRYAPQELSTLAEKAQSAGYFPPATGGQDVTTGEELVKALADEAAGRRTLYAKGANDKLAQSFAAREAAEAQNRSLANQHWNDQQDATSAHQAQQQADAEELAAWHKQMDEIGGADDYRSLGTGQEPPPEGYSERPAPQTEPTPTSGLTPQSLVRIHQEAGKAVKREFGVPVNTTSNKLMDSFRGRIGELLAGDENGAGALIPGYRDDLNRAGDYKGAQGAYEDFKGKLTGGRMDDFGKAVASLRDRQGNWIGTKLRGAQASLANEASEMWARGALKGGKFLVPGVQQRLELLFGRDGAQAFTTKMERVSEQAAAEARMAPFSGSPTAAMTEAMAEQNEAARKAGDLKGIGDAVLSAKFGKALGIAGRAANAYRQTPGSTATFRDELGRILTMKPDELKAFLEQMEAMGPAPKPATSPGLSGIVGGETLGHVYPGAAGMGLQAAPERRQPLY